MLQSVFGYPAFRGQQADVVSHVAAGGSAFVLMPTGGGKSLCYQVPALVRGGVTVVVSPLIALMQDQVAALRRRGVRAEVLNSTVAPDAVKRIEDDVRAGTVRLLYMAPDRLVATRTQALLAASPVSLFAIDEAHCIAEWGHDFRPEYLKLSLLHERFPHVPRVALTATADMQTRAEIVKRLNLERERVFLSSFDRPNITYWFKDKRDVYAQLLKFIRVRHAGAAGVVYCQSRAKVEETAAFLDGQGIPALPYHAGLSVGEREANQAWFLSRKGVTMVATIAFGMGIDKPDVRFVAHIELPKSVEGYYQETGRAGRDGKASEVWLAYSANDAAPLYERIKTAEIVDVQKRVQSSKLDAMVALCESAECRRMRLLAYFGEPCEPCGRCDICTSPPRTFDGKGVVRRVILEVARTGQRADAAAVATALGPRSVNAWQSTIRQCVSLGLLNVDHAAGGALKRTTESVAFMRGERAITLRRWRSPRAAARRERTAQVLAGEQLHLYKRLCAWRTDLARKRGTPAFVIFHDATLAEIARHKPATQWALRRIRGVGDVKLARHGRDVLRIVASAVAPIAH
ncbi:MAG TPA: RecQ family ATP-dependent DNA helicase [Gemmatimonadaceae bacterium]|nr:RecQ family ATP-dependent DNA helicase [Gemmatimonadaceae bacterium]